MYNVETGYHVSQEPVMAENNLMSWQGETLEFVSKRIAGILLQTKCVSIHNKWTNVWFKNNYRGYNGLYFMVQWFYHYLKGYQLHVHYFFGLCVSKLILVIFDLNMNFSHCYQYFIVQWSSLSWKLFHICRSGLHSC